MTTAAELMQLVVEQGPCVMFVASDGYVVEVPLDGMHPLQIIPDTPSPDDLAGIVLVVDGTATLNDEPVRARTICAMTRTEVIGRTLIPGRPPMEENSATNFKGAVPERMAIALGRTDAASFDERSG